MSDQKPIRVTTPAPEFTEAPAAPVPGDDGDEAIEDDDLREALGDIVTRLRRVERHLGIGQPVREHSITKRRSIEQPRPGIEPMTAED